MFAVHLDYLISQAANLPRSEVAAHLGHACGLDVLQMAGVGTYLKCCECNLKAYA